MDPLTTRSRAELPPARAVRLLGNEVAPDHVAALRERVGAGVAVMRPVAENSVRYFFAFLPLILPLLLAFGIVWIGAVANGP